MKYSPLDKVNLFLNIYGRMFAAIFRFRTWAGFLVLALFQAAGLFILARFYLPGIYTIIYPVISAFIPPIMLHYPQYYLSLTSIYSGFDDFILGPTIWVICSAWAVYNLGRYYDPQSRLAGDGLRTAFKAYLPLLLFWALETALVFGVLALPTQLAGRFAFGSPRRRMAFQFGTRVIAFCFSAFLVYTIPGIVLRARSLGRAVRESIGLCARNFFLTFFIIFIPGLFRVGLDIILSSFSPRIIKYLNPELILLILLIEIALGIFINLFIYGSAVFAYEELS